MPIKESADFDALCEVTRGVLVSIREFLEDDFWLNPSRWLTPHRLGNHKSTWGDVFAENSFVNDFTIAWRQLGRQAEDVEILGEEFLKSTKEKSNEALQRAWNNPANKARIYGLIDIIDGTDLLERRMSNWCSAVIYFDPAAGEGKRILAAFVALPNGDIYHARADVPGEAFVWRDGTDERERVRGPSVVTTVTKASICFYGQKIRRLISIADFLVKLNESLKSAEASGRSIDTRIYNLAGNPMMVRLVDKELPGAAGIDVVLEREGQMPHDVVLRAICIFCMVSAATSTVLFVLGMVLLYFLQRSPQTSTPKTSIQ